MKLLTTCVLFLFACTSSWSEDDPFGEPTKSNNYSFTPRHVRIQLKMIEISQTELTHITSSTQPLQENLYTSIQRLMKTHKAKLIHETIVVSRSGENATIESHCELIYPSDYEPEGYRLAVLGASPLPVVPSIRPYGSPPCAFETRNVGDELVVEPTLSKNEKTISLRLSHKQIKLNRNITYLTHKDQWGNADIFHPEFASQQTATAITLINKQPQLISTYTPHDKEGKPDPSRKILVFVKATVITPQ